MSSADTITPRRAPETAPAGAVGARVPRREDHALLAGVGQFVDDVRLPRMAHVRFARSGVAHARIVSLDTAAAEQLDGVVAVATARDLDLPPLLPPLETPGALREPRPMLADAVVRFAGEPYAAIVADSPYVAEDAVEALVPELEPLPVLADAATATAEGAATLHAHPTNTLFEGRFEHGDVDAVLRDAPIVVERTFSSNRQTALPMEPRGIVATVEGDVLRVWASTQAPHMLARAVAEALGLDRDAVHVRCPDVGGGFGLKAHVYPEEIVTAALALRLERPVKWVEDRADNLAAACHARDQEVRVRAAADADGTLLAIDADVTVDMGAYGVFGHGHILEPMGTPSMIPGPYRLPAYRYRSRAIATNKCPLGAYRGVGLPVAAFVHERVMDVLGTETGLGAAELRRRNLLTAEELPHVSVTGQRYDSGDYPAALEAALEAIGYGGFRAEQDAALRDGRLIGLGLASYVEYTGVNSRVFAGRGMRAIAGWDDALVRLDGDGRVELWTTLPSAGQGLATTFAQMAADAIGVPLEAVTVVSADTGVGGLDGTGTFASRSAISGGGAIDRACAEIVRRLKDDAADELEIAPEDLEIRDGRVAVVGAPQRALPVARIVADAPEDRYRVSARFDPPAVVYPYATHACRVSVDSDTGRVAIDRYVVVEDCGRVINPTIVEGQVHGAVAQGIAGALYESIVYDQEGQLLTGSLMDYLVPTAPEIPRFDVHHLAIPAPESPNGAKGVGEGGTIAPGPAIANAVTDALGAECNALPVHPEWARSAARARLDRTITDAKGTA